MTKQEREAVEIFLSFARMNSDAQRRYFGRFVLRKWLFDALGKRAGELRDILGQEIYQDCYSSTPPRILVCGVPVEFSDRRKRVPLSSAPGGWIHAPPGFSYVLKIGKETSPGSSCAP